MAGDGAEGFKIEWHPVAVQYTAVQENTHVCVCMRCSMSFNTTSNKCQSLTLFTVVTTTILGCFWPLMVLGGRYFDWPAHVLFSSEAQQPFPECEDF